MMERGYINITENEQHESWLKLIDRRNSMAFGVANRFYSFCSVNCAQYEFHYHST